MEQKIIEMEDFGDIIEELTSKIEELKGDALRQASSILNRNVTIQSLNGIVGGKNNTYVDSVRTRFLDFKDFFSKWLKGLNDTYNSERETYLKWNNNFDWTAKASFRNIRLLHDDKIFQYTKTFLERNFYKYINQRIRLKPNEKLWEIWFGYPPLTYGLLIAPKKTINGWRIDKSEIRRADYSYWTIGHILATGLIDPNINDLIKFTNLEYFCKIYLSVFKGLSKSSYEKEIYDKYVNYLNKSSDPYNEPFLIPEFRYAGLKKQHEYRLDFTILNQHSSEFIGFEISPASSHMKVINLKHKQADVNKELKEKWEREMSKRNQYFDNFGITTKTFTDKHLTNLDTCFEQIEHVLSNRPVDRTTVEAEIGRLKRFWENESY